MSGSMTRRGVLTGAAAIAGVTALPAVPEHAPGGRSAIGHVVVDERLIAIRRLCRAAFAGPALTRSAR